MNTLAEPGSAVDSCVNAPWQPLSQEPPAPQAYPLSAGQQALWFVHSLAPDQGAYHFPFCARVKGDLNVPALRRALQMLVDRHASLRTTFTMRAGQPAQLVHTHQDVSFEEIDGSSWTEAELAERLSAEIYRPFDLERGPVLRSRLVREPGHDYVFLLLAHHIVLDGRSLQVLLDELEALYLCQARGERVTLAPLELQYTDYVYWQRDLLAGPDGDRLLAYWLQQLGDAPPGLDLPTDRPRPPVLSSRGANYHFQVGERLTARLRALAKSQGATLYMTLLGAFQTLLYRYSGQEDILVGSPAAGRSYPEFDGLIGYFSNPLVLRAKFSAKQSFRDFLTQVRDTVLAALEHQDLPFALLVERLQPPRDSSRSPLFQTIFAFEQWRGQGLSRFITGDPGACLPWGGLVFEPVSLAHQAAQFDLALMLEDAGDRLFASAQYSTDLFDAATIERLAGHFLTLLEGIATDPDQPVATLPLLTPAEKQQLLVEWNQTETEYPRDVCIHRMFERQVEQTPDAVALDFANQQVSYRELNQRANQLAHYLQQHGVGPEVIVAVSTERSPEMVVAWLGVLKAGGAFLPLDPTYPKDRLAFILEDTQAPLFLCNQVAHAPNSPGCTPVACTPGSPDWQLIATQSTENPKSDVGIDNLGYVIYTSGSTGRPKGVLLSHCGMGNLALAQIRAFDIRPDSRVLQFASPGFDASVSEVFTALLAGATLCLAAREDLLPGPDLFRLLRRRAITTVTLPPSALALLSSQDLPALRTVIAAGETCPATVVARWAAGRRFINAYGPSEATVCATLGECTDGQHKPSIGRPMANVKVYLLDEHLQPVPIGLSGEIYLAGPGLARGYLNQDALTAAKFIADPFSALPGARLYKTGDKARYRPDGTIDFLGRDDRQVKLRGFRIELEEIEAVLRKHQSVRDAAVQVWEDSAGDKRLAAYVGGTHRPSPSASDLRLFLRQHLPEHMVPAQFTFLDALPINASGKVDRAALSRLTCAPQHRDRVPLHDPLQQKLARIWEDVLGSGSVGPGDNFFDLGGHSLLAVRLLYTIKEQLGQELPLSILVHEGTIAQMAARLRQGASAPSRSPLVKIRAGSRKPLFWVHPIGGDIRCYQELVRCLDLDRPVYGLDSLALAPEEEAPQIIEAMAARYVQAVQSIQPQGPYILGGWSLGGVIAFEMCRQLEAMGDTVATVALLDSFVFDSETEPELANTSIAVRLFIRELQQRFGLAHSGEQELPGDTVVEQLAHLEQQLGHGSEPTEDALARQRLYQVFRTHFLAFLGYRPMPISAPLVLFQAAESFAQFGARHEVQWRRLTCGGLTLFRIPGDHYSLLTQPAAGMVAKQLQEYLEGSVLT